MVSENENKQEVPPLTDKILLNEYGILKQATILYISTYVLTVVKKSCIIHLKDNGDEKIYLNVDMSNKEVDVLVSFKDEIQTSFNPLKTYPIEDLFTFWSLIKDHDLKPMKIRQASRADLD